MFLGKHRPRCKAERDQQPAVVKYLLWGCFGPWSAEHQEPVTEDAHESKSSKQGAWAQKKSYPLPGLPHQQIQTLLDVEKKN